MKTVVAIVAALSMLLQSHGLPTSDAQCSAVTTIAERRDCGSPGITQTECEDKGCCYNAETRRAFWCFFKANNGPTTDDPQCSAVAEAARTDCGYPGITSTQCEERGCCFNGEKSNTTWCFYKEINECAEGLDNCACDAKCIDKVDGFTCVCKQGYTGSGVTCTDVDECVQGGDDCDCNAVCTNTIGGFTCACKEGYTGSGQTCQELCPLKGDDVYYRNGVCYKLLTSKVLWDQANVACLSLTPSSHLAELNTTQKLHDVTDIATEAGATRLYTAAKRKPGTRDVYIWSHSGATIPDTFFIWGAGDPDQEANEDYLMLDLTYQSYWAWHDIGTGWPMAFVCEL